jgi:MSHA biogenesis protein MshM
MSALYLKHFDLEKSPFQITPDIDFFFSGSQRGGMLTALLHVASHEEGIVTAVAEVGSGKTLLARLMISRLPPDISTVYLANPCFSRDEIISAISRDLGLSGQCTTTEENLAGLHHELLRRHSLGQRVLLVIDEAHAMPPESLEEVRLLSNLETDRHKLVNIMLFGQPELDTLIQDRRLRQVRDRVIHRFELPPLPKDEAVAYIDHRLRIAGWRGGRLFTKGALGYLLKASQGRARRINLLARTPA